MSRIRSPEHWLPTDGSAILVVMSIFFLTNTDFTCCVYGVRNDGDIGYRFGDCSDSQFHPRGKARGGVAGGAGVHTGGGGSGPQDEQVSGVVQHEGAGGIGSVGQQPGGQLARTLAAQRHVRPCTQKRKR